MSDAHGTGRRIVVPEDLGDVLVAAGLAAEYSNEWRSAFPGMIETVASASCIVITLLQAPPTISQTAESIRTWFLRRKAQGAESVSMTATLPTGQRVDVTITGTEGDYIAAAKLVILMHARADDKNGA